MELEYLSVLAYTFGSVDRIPPVFAKLDEEKKKDDPAKEQKEAEGGNNIEGSLQKFVEVTACRNNLSLHHFGTE
jgi:hypothetical protein